MYNVQKRLKLKLRLLFIVYPLLLLLSIIIFLFSKGLTHYLYLLIIPALVMLWILGYIGIKEEIKNNNINNKNIIYGKKYVYLSIVFTVLVVLLFLCLYKIFY